MRQVIKKICYYLVLPLIVVVGIILSLNCHFHNLEKAITSSALIIQSLAIFIGGLWTYHKFDWNKKAESAIKIKAMLMDYEQAHAIAAMQYRVDQHDQKDWLESWGGYATRMIPYRNAFTSQVQVLCYLPKKIRIRVLEAIFLSLNNGKSLQSENLDENWIKFGKEIEILKKELDNLVSK